MAFGGQRGTHRIATGLDQEGIALLHQYQPIRLQRLFKDLQKLDPRHRAAGRHADRAAGAGINGTARAQNVGQQRLGRDLHRDALRSDRVSGAQHLHAGGHGLLISRIVEIDHLGAGTAATPARAAPAIARRKIQPGNRIAHGFGARQLARGARSHLHRQSNSGKPDHGPHPRGPIGGTGRNWQADCDLHSSPRAKHRPALTGLPL